MVPPQGPHRARRDPRPDRGTRGRRDDRRIHKVVHHYLLQATGGALGTENDPDGEAIDVAWFPLNEVANHLTFPNERRIAQAAWERLAGTA